MRLASVLSVLFLLLLAAAVRAEPRPGPFKKIAVIRLREESGEAIDMSVKTSVLRRIEQIREWGADCVVLDIESYGGLVSASIETGDEIYALGREIHTIAYISRKAISGAAMLALSCQEIVMHEVAGIGDAQAIYRTADGSEKAPEKIQTVVAAKFRLYAEGNGYPAPIAQAMVRAEMEVIRYRVREPGDGPQWKYFRSDRTDSLPSRREIEEMGLEEPPQVIVAEGELAMVNAKEAVEYGIASKLSPTLKGFLASISDADTEVRHLDWNWSERVSRFLLAWRFLLFLVGAGALYFAMKMPGTGIPEVLALICFGLFFGASAISGFAGTIEMVLFFAGILLLVVEIFLLPGFGVPGFLGVACILGSIALAALPDVPGELPASPGYFLLPMAKSFLAATILAFFVVLALARFLPTVPLFRRLHMDPAPQQTGSAVPIVGSDASALVGEKGVAESPLRPAGTAKIGGKRMDVVAEAGLIEPGTPVRVVSVQGNVVTVRADEPR
ncbi:MAG: NfeD family protein [Planctomycetota bacterium]|jgi:membrane-bound serine protease (ClpP class)